MKKENLTKKEQVSIIIAIAARIREVDNFLKEGVKQKIWVKDDGIKSFLKKSLKEYKDILKKLQRG